MPVRKRFCEARAQELLDERLASRTPPVDVEVIANGLFLRVVRAETGEHRGRARLDHDEIRVNANESAGRSAVLSRS